MSSADAAWLRMDRPTNLMIVNSVLWFDEPVDWDRCKAVFLDRIVARFDRFRQRAADGLPLTGPHWEDDPAFDPDLHFHHVALPAPHDRAALQDFIADRISTPLDHSRPLWEVYLIDDFGSGCAILVRIHHSVADGIALARVMLTLTDGGEPGAGIAERGGRQRHSPARPRVRGPLREHRWSTRASRRCCTPSTLARSRRAPPATRRRSPSCCCRAPTRRPRSRASSRSPTASRGPRPSRCGGSSAPAARTARPSTTCSSARSPRPSAGTCARSGDGVDEVHALVPFNLRPLDQPLPRELGNRFGLVLLGLPVGIEDPLAAARRGQAPDGRDQEQPRRRVRLRHPQPDRPHAGPARGAPDRLLLRQGLDGPHQRPRAAQAGSRSPGRRSAACSCGRPARAASG